MTTIEPTIEDLEELSRLQTLDELYEREEALRFWAEIEERQRRRAESAHDGSGDPDSDPEFDPSEQEYYLPD